MKFGGEYMILRDTGAPEKALLKAAVHQMNSTRRPKPPSDEGRGTPVAYPAKQERDGICEANDGGSAHTLAVCTETEIDMICSLFTPSTTASQRSPFLKEEGFWRVREHPSKNIHFPGSRVASGNRAQRERVP